MTELPFLAQSSIAQAFAGQCPDFGYLYDRSQMVGFVGSRWAVGDSGDLLLKAAIGSYCNRLFNSYPADTPRRLQLLDARFRQGVLSEVKPHLPKWKFSEQFDQDTLLLGVPGNGVVDLSTGEVREMQRTDYLSKRAIVRPDSNREPKRFLEFMDEITGSDKELNAYLMRFCGYVLTGSVKEHCLPFWHGGGANGKGTLLAVLQGILGYEYSTVVRMDDLTKRDRGDDNQRRVIAKLAGCRLVACNEGNQKVALNMALLKSLSSSDLLSGANLYESEFTFRPSHKLIIASNSKPELEIDDAARRRTHLVPFNVSFRGRENKNLESELKAEAPGIMALMIKACMEWQRIGLMPPQSVTEATDALFRDLDPLSRFMDARLERDPLAFTSSDALFRAYGAFLAAEDELFHIDQKQVITAIRDRGGYERAKARNTEGQEQRGLRGVKIKDPDI
jgi:putative DNA primase/helicase